METLPQNEPEQEHGVGPIAGVIIIVAILLIGGVYFLLMETNKQVPEETKSQATNQ